MVIWITGLSGAGKSSIGGAVHHQLKLQMENVVLVDGDQVRGIMSHDLGYTAEDRRIGATRISRLCKWLDSEGINVVCATIGFFDEIREWNRKHIPHYFEVYVRVDLNVLLERESGGLYKGALAGETENVVGVDLQLSPPKTPDLIIDNNRELDCFEPFANQIISGLPWPIAPKTTTFEESTIHCDQRGTFNPFNH